MSNEKNSWTRRLINALLCGRSSGKVQEQIQHYDIDRCYALLTGDEGSRNRYLFCVRKDLELMESVLTKLNFVVYNPCLDRDKRTVRPLTRQILYDKYINGLSGDEQAQYSCFLFYFSGHGNSNGILLSSGRVGEECVKYNEIVQTFNSASSDKPKIFIFDCCRDTPESAPTDHDNCCCDKDIPRHVTIVFACMSEDQCTGGSGGSFFTRELELRLGTLYTHLSFGEIIAQVSGNVDPSPLSKSTLTKRLCFKACATEQPNQATTTKKQNKGIGTIFRGAGACVDYTTAAVCKPKHLEAGLGSYMLNMHSGTGVLDGGERHVQWTQPTTQEHRKKQEEAVVHTLESNEFINIDGSRGGNDTNKLDTSSPQREKHHDQGIQDRNDDQPTNSEEGLDQDALYSTPPPSPMRPKPPPILPSLSIIRPSYLDTFNLEPNLPWLKLALSQSLPTRNAAQLHAHTSIQTIQVPPP